MHILFLVIGVLLGIYGLYRFFLSATVKQVTALLFSTVFLVLCAALFFLALTGRLPAALGLLAALWPLGLMAWQRRRNASGASSPAGENGGTMTRAEAYEVLGLSEGATEEEIKAAHKNLIKKTHPDQQGSDWLAAKINQARDLLLR